MRACVHFSTVTNIFAAHCLCTSIYKILIFIDNYLSNAYFHLAHLFMTAVSLESLNTPQENAAC